MATIRLTPKGRWQDVKTGRFVTAPIKNSKGQWVDPKTKKFVKVEAPKPVQAPQPAKPAKGKVQARKIPKHKSPYIMTADEFFEKYGLPDAGLQYEGHIEPEHIKFKRSVVNMCVARGASIAIQRKIRRMDADKLLQLYYEDPSLFDMYFEYEPEAEFEYGWESEDLFELVVRVYENRFNVVL